MDQVNPKRILNRVKYRVKPQKPFDSCQIQPSTKNTDGFDLSPGPRQPVRSATSTSYYTFERFKELILTT